MARTAPSIPATFGTVLVYSRGETIGDGIVKLPFLRVLRARFPGAHITWCAGLGRTAYAHALTPLIGGLLDEVIEAAGIGDRPGHLLGLHRPLAGRAFDLVIDTQTSILRSLIARRIRHGVFVSACAGWRFSDLKPDRPEAWPRHFVRSLQGLARLAAPAAEDGPLPPLPRDPALDEAARRRLPDGPVYVGLAPGAGDAAKRWPLEGFIATARDQVSKGRVPVFFPGPEEESWIPRLRAAVPEARFPEWEDAADGDQPQGPLLVIALAGRLSAALANDSGTGHMLAAGGAPLVSLFSKHDPAKYAPVADRLAIVDSKDFGGRDPALIPQDAVIGALDRMVAGA
ncbi:MAG: glycosyltransferase family 9 protein [Alphaproteobacteria bacterium]|nr:glycosyltransferase family 9 protein [Alphaproteobacteria bacterium]